MTSLRSMFISRKSIDVCAVWSMLFFKKNELQNLINGAEQKLHATELLG